MHQAAAVLVLRKNRVLGFRRYDREGIALPCGGLKAGETPQQAALRECAEETGYRVHLVEEEPPYVGFDPLEKSLVTTYRAEVDSLEVATTPTEGQPAWVSIRTLTEGPFGHYNERMLRHFGVNPWPLVGKFHSHLTLHGTPEEVQRAAKLVAGKVTYIDLSRADSARAQTDAMVTNHYVTGAHGLEDEHDVLTLLRAKAKQLSDSGIEVARVKLEYDVFGKGSPQVDVDRALQRPPYTEIHVKTRLQPDRREEVTQEACRQGWHPSRNPFAEEQGGLVQFLNRRFYVETEHLSWVHINRHIDNLTRWLVQQGVDLLEIKYETAIFDSNDAVDRWWME